MASMLFSKFPKGLALAAAGLLALTLAGCSTGGLVQNGKIAGAETPAAEEIGEGQHVIGMIVADEESSLSDGIANSSYLAGKLAATTLTGAPVTLVIRRYDRSASAVKKVAAELLAAGAEIIIGPDDAAGAATLAQLLQGKHIPILSLAQGADMGLGVYGAGLAIEDEIATTMGELQQRGHKTIMIARVGGAASTAYATTLGTAAAKAGIAATEVDFTDAAAGLSRLKQLPGAGTGMPDALVFAISQDRAGPVISELRGLTDYANMDMVGNASWSLSLQPLPETTGPIWYPALANNNLAGFSQKFAAANNQRPTLRSAVAYDLVVMAGALPQLIDDAPYSPDVLTNDQGFKGLTGSFRFDSNGTGLRTYVINKVK